MNGIYKKNINNFKTPQNSGHMHLTSSKAKIDKFKRLNATKNTYLRKKDYINTGDFMTINSVHYFHGLKLYNLRNLIKKNQNLKIPSIVRKISPDGINNQIIKEKLIESKKNNNNNLLYRSFSVQNFSEINENSQQFPKIMQKNESSRNNFYKMNVKNLRKHINYETFKYITGKDSLRIKSGFKQKDQFEKFIINNFIENKKNINEPVKNKYREIFVILDGEIIINKNNIIGHYIKIPFNKEMYKLTEEKQKELYNNILKDIAFSFGSKNTVKTLFTPDKEIITNLLEIKDEYKFLYASQTNLCNGITIVSTPDFIHLYQKDFNSYLLNKKNDLKKSTKIIYTHKKKFKIKNTYKGINKNYEKYKPHYSFANGENDIENKEYLYYSDNESNKKEKSDKIIKNCHFKNDFFLYLNNNVCNNSFNRLQKKLNFANNFDLRESYLKFEANIDKMINRFKKEIQKKLQINKNIYNIDPIDSKIQSHNMQFPNSKITKLYLKRHQKTKSNSFYKSRPTSFYYSINKKIRNQYTHFILYNIPKLLKEFKNFSRRRLFEIFTKYKDLASISYASKKLDFVLQNGIDFNTFWKCTEGLSEEKEKFAYKIYHQINKSQLCVLNMKDFFKGMYFIQNNDIAEKLDLFLQTLDISGKGTINFNEAVEICKESIERNMTDSKEKTDNYALNELSLFFAEFIYKLIGKEKNEEFKISELKDVIVEGNQNNKDIEYLEMFCGAN